MRDPSMGRAPPLLLRGQLHFVALSKIAPGDFVEPAGSNLSLKQQNKKATARVAFLFCWLGD